MIGAGVRVAGNITFTGVLRVQGDILGDVSGGADSSATIVVDKSGNVAGTIKAPHIVVSGRVYGPAHSSESIEIQQGACFVGDTFYKTMEIHAGGVIEGSLTPRISKDRDRLKQESFNQISEPSAAKEYGMPVANTVSVGGRFLGYVGSSRKLGAILTLLIAVVAVVLVNRNPPPVTPPLADVALSATQSVSAGSGGLQDGAGTVAGDAAPLVSGPNAETKNVALSLPPDQPEMAPEKTVEVPGVNPGKAADVFSVISKEASVLFKKKHQDPADGTRIDIPKGASVNIAIAKNEIFRVAKGQGLVIFYQGRKVAPKVIESGAWMSFIPQSPGRAGDKR